MKDDDMTSNEFDNDFNNESESDVFERNKLDMSKVDSRRKLEEYLENRKLENELDY